MSKNKIRKTKEIDRDEDYAWVDENSSQKSESDEEFVPGLRRTQSSPFPKPSSKPKRLSLESSPSGLSSKKSSTKKRKSHIEIDREDFETSDLSFQNSGSSKLIPGEEPQGWLEIYEKIEEIRRGYVAPVDEFGCDVLGEWEKVSQGLLEAKVARFYTLIALMLSSQTKDQVTAAAVQNLKKFGLTVENMKNCEESQIDELISKVGFHTRKATYIKKTAQILSEKYDGDIPTTIEEITALPGVGPKMGYLLMQIALNNVTGIGVDVHVHRISNRLRWVKSNGPEETRSQLEKWLPKEKWGKINQLLVGFGQTICLPVGPKCNICPVNDKCPSSNIKTATKNKL